MENLQLWYSSGYRLKHLRDTCIEIINVIYFRVQENPA